jgi:hypothetical protein
MNKHVKILGGLGIVALCCVPTIARADNLRESCTIFLDADSGISPMINYNSTQRTLQEWSEKMAAQRVFNENHINYLKKVYEDYCKEDNSNMLSSLLERNQNSNSLEDLQNIYTEAEAEKTKLEENKAVTIAEEEAARIAAENAAKTTYNNHSSASSKTSNTTNSDSKSTSYTYSFGSTSSTSETYTNTGDAKSWIINKESSGNYNAQNGRYYGAYQLDSSYLNGDYSKENQDRVAEEYVSNRYGSWENAKTFWEQNGWY